MTFLLRTRYDGVFSPASPPGLLMAAVRQFDNSPTATSISLRGTATMLMAAAALGLLL